MRDLYVEVARGEDPLKRRVWTFVILDFPRVHLEEYAEQERPSKRHKWRTKAHYTRLSYRGEGEVIREEPEVPEDVLKEAVGKYRERLEFKVWGRR